YRFVVTPTLESVDALALGLGPEQQRRLFKFADADGSLIALVGEKTIPVARLAAGQLRSAPLPLRLCYAASVVSNDGGRFANRRETHQVGAELVGAAGPAADAEVIALAVRCPGAARRPRDPRRRRPSCRQPPIRAGAGRPGPRGRAAPRARARRPGQPRPRRHPRLRLLHGRDL